MGPDEDQPLTKWVGRDRNGREKETLNLLDHKTDIKHCIKEEFDQVVI